MKVITYLAFTLLSILIQFCVMDFIQEKIQLNDTMEGIDYSQKRTFGDILRNVSHKPHALFYRNTMSKQPTMNKNLLKKTHVNTTLKESLLDTSTESSTILEVLFDENDTSTDSAFTTESFFTTTEFDNVTEITLFEKNETATEPKKQVPKTVEGSKICSCNLLHQVCDINCCCDSECSDKERELFGRCSNTDKSVHEDSCYPHFLLFGGHSSIDDLFCIVKTNLPEKRPVRSHKLDELTLKKVRDMSFKWHESKLVETKYEFKKKAYQYGDPVWLLKNGTIHHMDLPAPSVNNYCSHRAPMKFLREESVKCNVMLRDLEMLQILPNIDDAKIISATDLSANATSFNCSTFFCSNWNITICDGIICTSYNKSLHEPSCSDNFCTNVASKVDYIFNYYDSKITNATIKLQTKTISTNVPFITQEINVKFYMSNETASQMIAFSGNPGYIHGLPVIVSYAKDNYTEDFFNTTTSHRYVPFPENVNGKCSLSAKNVLKFGVNKRVKCKYALETSIAMNDTNVCTNLQKQLNVLFGLSNKSLAVSPVGNPTGLADHDWLKFEVSRDESVVYDEFIENTSKIICYNVITRVSVIVSYADTRNDVMKENRIVSAKLQYIAGNVTLSVDDPVVVITLDTIYIDASAPPSFKFAGGPHIDIHLPRDFFFPFPSNDSSVNSLSFILYILLLRVLVYH